MPDPGVPQSGCAGGLLRVAAQLDRCCTPHRHRRRLAGTTASAGCAGSNACAQTSRQARHVALDLHDVRAIIADHTYGVPSALNMASSPRAGRSNINPVIFSEPQSSAGRISISFQTQVVLGETRRVDDPRRRALDSHGLREDCRPGYITNRTVLVSPPVVWY
jgi:hypothetical protein